jgi:heme-degrading monooxygenase HmoA
MEGSCEHGDEPSGCIKSWEILDKLSEWRLSRTHRHEVSYGREEKYMQNPYFKI